MKTPSLGWQSWSPPVPNFLHFPPRDYCPVPELPRNYEKMHSRKNVTKPIIYWCTWYALGYHPKPEDILCQAKLIKQLKLPITHILIDDGWSESWLKKVSTTLHKMGFKVGLWYAPFTRHSNLPTKATLSRLITNNHLDLLKLDFLYKPYFAKNLKDDTFPHQTLVKLFTFLSERFPKLTVIVCGCPFAPAVGHVPIIRISKDTTFPPPVPKFLKRLLYASRTRLLLTKFNLIPSNFPLIPDPDVRMLTLDTPTTTVIWDTIHSSCLGVGDNLTHLTESQIKTYQLWLHTNLISPSSSQR